eukprot:4985623-Prymnesium_polylepis.1
MKADHPRQTVTGESCGTWDRRRIRIRIRRYARTSLLRAYFFFCWDGSVQRQRDHVHNRPSSPPRNNGV